MKVFGKLVAITAILLQGYMAMADGPVVQHLVNFDSNEAVSEVIVRRLSLGKVSPFSPNGYVSDCSEMEKDDDTASPMGEIDLLKIVNTGLKIWKVIEDNEPVMNIKNQMGHALPEGIQCWDELSNWQVPRSAVYEVVYKNLFGAEVAKLQFRLIYSYGGSFDGQGKYLSNISLRPSEVNVLWGYTLNANVEIPQVLNMGSTTSPIAGAELTLNWQVETKIKKSSNSFSVFVDGQGNLKQL